MNQVELRAMGDVSFFLWLKTWPNTYLVLGSSSKRMTKCLKKIQWCNGSYIAMVSTLSRIVCHMCLVSVCFSRFNSLDLKNLAGVSI